MSLSYGKFYDAFDYSAGHLTTFDAPADTPGILVVTGSAWRKSGSGKIGVNISLTGKSGNVTVTSTTLWANQHNVHMTLPTAFREDKLLAGNNVIRILPIDSDTVIDANDRFVVCFISS